MFIVFLQTRLRYILEYRTLHNHCCETLNFCIPMTHIQSLITVMYSTKSIKQKLIIALLVKIFSSFCEGSLLCLEKHTTGPYPVSNKSSKHVSSWCASCCVNMYPFIWLIYSHLCLGLPNALLKIFLARNCMHFSSHLFMLHVPAILSSLIL
jgi:hypothetical protein